MRSNNFPSAAVEGAVKPVIVYKPAPTGESYYTKNTKLLS